MSFSPSDAAPSARTTLWMTIASTASLLFSFAALALKVVETHVVKDRVTGISSRERVSLLFSSTLYAIVVTVLYRSTELFVDWWIRRAGTSSHALASDPNGVPHAYSRNRLFGAYLLAGLWLFALVVEVISLVGDPTPVLVAVIGVIVLEELLTWGIAVKSTMERKRMLKEVSPESSGFLMK